MQEKRSNKSFVIRIKDPNSNYENIIMSSSSSCSTERDKNSGHIMKIFRVSNKLRRGSSKIDKTRSRITKRFDKDHLSRETNIRMIIEMMITLIFFSSSPHFLPVSN